MKINDKIRERRLQLDLTLEEVADAVGVAKSTVKKWESGQIESMRRSKIAALAKILRVPPLYLIYEDEELANGSNVTNSIIGNENHHNTITVSEHKVVPNTPIVSAITTICNSLSENDQAKVLAFVTDLLSGKKESK